MHFLVRPVLTIIAHMRTLETGRLILRPGTPDDIENFEAFYRGMGPEGVPPTTEAMRAENDYYLSYANYRVLKPFGRWLIILKADQQPIGVSHLMPRLCTPEETALIFPAGDRLHSFGSIEVEIGCAIARPYREQGFAREATRALLSYGFGKMKLQHILAFTDHDNTASINAMKNLGMRIVSPLESATVIGVVENNAA